MANLGNALILSPFATHPLDAGQRKRAFQTTSLLKEWGFSITFLHFAFETRWYWGHNKEDDRVLKDQWTGDVLHFYANKNVGLPPAHGESHLLDEWWDEALGSYISNVFSKRQYDLFVVHNIWLTKAFDYAPYHCMKVLDMHDLFSQRAKEFYATGVSPEFFHCSETDEILGLQRADLLFAIKHEDNDWCTARELGNTQVITIPYVEQSGAVSTKDEYAIDVKPLNPGKLVFGMIGSDMHFNRHAVHAFIKELDYVIRVTYAPIEFILAGSICRSVSDCPVFVKKLGFVNQVSDFYSSIDVVIVPMLNGTGVKIKSAEAVSYHKPVLFTDHSAEGICYPGETYSSLADMAKAASLLALAHDIPARLLLPTYSAFDDARAELERSRIAFKDIYRRKRPALLHILAPTSSCAHKSSLEALAGLLLFKSLVSHFRPIALAVHPSLGEYVPSVPSYPLPLVHDLASLGEAVKTADIILVSYSQYNMLEPILSSHRSSLLLIDMRNYSAAHLGGQLQSLMGQESNELYFVVSPTQASLLNQGQLLRVVVIPLINSRCQWDPHIDQAFFLHRQNDLIESFMPDPCQSDLSENDLVMIEGIDSVRTLVNEFQNNCLI
jgi:hypothetical protein